jgi:exoribonuclease R
MRLERDGDDIARCFLLERLLYEHGHDQSFAGEVIGLIAAGVFVRFGPELPDGVTRAGAGEGEAVADGGLPFEGMIPVRSLRAAERDAGREWWELNEQGTILEGERSGTTLRLGQPVQVRVTRIEAVRGRVELTGAG